MLSIEERIEKVKILAGIKWCGAELIKVLAEFAYDASRSGTNEQVYALMEYAESRMEHGEVLDFEASMATGISVGEIAVIYAKAAFKFALAGVGNDAFVEKIVETTLHHMTTFSTTLCLESQKDARNLLGAAGTRSVPLHDTDGGALHALWVHSSRQKKVRTRETSKGEPGTRLLVRGAEVRSARDFGLADTSLPLVLDIGCGFGTTILGLAGQWVGKPAETAGNLWGTKGRIDKAFGKKNKLKMNFIGCDLAHHCIKYASGVARRHGLAGYVSFLTMSGEDLIRKVLDLYEGSVFVTLIQFPTPYKLLSLGPQASTPSAPVASPPLTRKRHAANIDKRVSKRARGTGTGGSGDGNTQLPSIDSGFMVNQGLAELVAKLVEGKAVETGKAETRPRVLIQSNVEDVAYTMAHRLREACPVLQPVSRDSFGEIVPTATATYPQWAPTRRQKRWYDVGGKRPTGDGWLTQSAFPYARTETEATYEIMGTPLHRYLLWAE